MKDQIRQLFASGLSLSVVDGRLKVAGTPEAVETFRPVLKQYRDEIIKRLQADSAIEKAPAMFAPVEPETNATAGTGEQSRHALPCSENDKALLADAVLLIGKIEHTRPEMAAELIRAFNTVEAAEHAGNQADFDFALEVLRAAVDDAATLAEKESEVLYVHRSAM